MTREVGMPVNDYVRMGMGDSRNPDEILSGKQCMHTDSIVAYIKFDGVWYRARSMNPLGLKSYFSDAKTHDDCKYIIECLIEEGIIEI